MHNFLDNEKIGRQVNLTQSLVRWTSGNFFLISIPEGELLLRYITVRDHTLRGNSCCTALQPVATPSGGTPAALHYSQRPHTQGNSCCVTLQPETTHSGGTPAALYYGQRLHTQGELLLRYITARDYTLRGNSCCVIIRSETTHSGGTPAALHYSQRTHTQGELRFVLPVTL